MKTYNFFDKDGDLVERKKCSLKEAEVYSNNLGFRFEEYKRGKNGKDLQTM